MLRETRGLIAKRKSEGCIAVEMELAGVQAVCDFYDIELYDFLEAGDVLEASSYDIEGLSNKALVEYAKRYAKEQEYSLDEFAVLALHSRIDDMQTNDHSVTIEEVKEIVNEAIDKANKKNLRHFFDVLCSNRYDEEDMIILRERDFETE